MVSEWLMKRDIETRKYQANAAKMNMTDPIVPVVSYAVPVTGEVA